MDAWISWVPAPIVLALTWMLLKYFSGQILDKLKSVDTLRVELHDLRVAIKDFVTQEQFQSLKERVIVLEQARKPKR